jgi:hypothetical protein
VWNAVKQLQSYEKLQLIKYLFISWWLHKCTSTHIRAHTHTHTHEVEYVKTKEDTLLAEMWDQSTTERALSTYTFMLHHSCHYKKHLLSSVFGTANCCSIALSSVISKAGKFLIFKGFQFQKIENRVVINGKWEYSLVEYYSQLKIYSQAGLSGWVLTTFLTEEDRSCTPEMPFLVLIRKGISTVMTTT